MPRAIAIKPQFTFTRGLLTEASELNYPSDFFEDGDNIELDTKGDISRRLGLGAESNYVLSSTSLSEGIIAQYAIDGYVWRNVAGDGNRNFVVLQVGPTLYFYDLSTDPVSGNEKSFTVDLVAFASPSATNLAGSYVYYASGNSDKLFVTGSQIEPFYIEYDVDTDSISTSVVSVEIRDFSGVDDGLDIDEQLVTLSDLHKYNLKNQGWLPTTSSAADPITTYFSAVSKYPANNQQWWVGKDSSENFSATLLDKYFFGNSPAPKGHYIVNRFHIDRSTVSGVPNIPVEAESTRPQTVAFFAGRVWYGFKNELLFSQVLESNNNIGKCYQSADPTSEEISDLLPTDGGRIPIPEAGTIITQLPIGQGLLAFANNGIWFVSGPEQSFKANDFFTIKISGAGILSPRSVVDVEGIPIWWASDGIYTLEIDKVSGVPSVVNITDATIKTFYVAIPAVAKENAKGVYDPKRREVRWLYSDNTEIPSDTPYKYNKMLTLDLRLQAFKPATVSDLGGMYPILAGAFALPSINTINVVANVVADEDNVVVGSDNLVAGTITTSISGSTLSTKYIILTSSSRNVQWTFGELNNTSFHDFAEFDSGEGADAESFFVTGWQVDGDIGRLKQAPYLQCFFRRTETAFEENDGVYTLLNPSSCIMQGRWDWANSAAAGKWSNEQQVYRFKRDFIVNPSNLTFDYGYEIIVTKTKVRGVGKSYQFKFRSEENKAFNLLGWNVLVEGNQAI